MKSSSFLSWLHRRTESASPLRPESDKVMLFVAQPGPQGITRYKLGRAIKLEPEALNDLLDALVESGLLVRTFHNELQVFHARNGVAGAFIVGSNN